MNNSSFSDSGFIDAGRSRLTGSIRIASVVAMAVLASSCNVREEGTPRPPELSQSDRSSQDILYDQRVGADGSTSTNRWAVARNAEILGSPFENRGGIATECLVEPALPDGLVFRIFGNSCVLSGRAEAVSSPATYAFSARNSGGASTPINATVEVVEATAFFADINGDAAIATGDKPLSVVRDVTFRFTARNLGFSSPAGSNTCALTNTATGDTATALEGVTATLAENGRDCVISGIVSEEITESDNIELTLSTTTTADAETGAVAATGMTVFPIVVFGTRACSEIELDPAQAGSAFPIPVMGGTADSLYFRGNHASWSPQPRYIFSPRIGNALQLLATISTIIGPGPDPMNPSVPEDMQTAGDYDPTMTQFKIASDDSTWTTQLFVPVEDDPSSVRTNDAATGGLLEFGVAHPLVRANGGVDNNWVSLALGASYMITIRVTDTSSGDGEKGTIEIEQCRL